MHGWWLGTKGIVTHCQTPCPTCLLAQHCSSNDVETEVIFLMEKRTPCLYKTIFHSFTWWNSDFHSPRACGKCSTLCLQETTIPRPEMTLVQIRPRRYMPLLSGSIFSSSSSKSWASLLCFLAFLLTTPSLDSSCMSHFCVFRRWWTTWLDGTFFSIFCPLPFQWWIVVSPLSDKIVSITLSQPNGPTEKYDTHGLCCFDKLEKCSANKSLQIWALAACYAMACSAIIM